MARKPDADDHRGSRSADEGDRELTTTQEAADLLNVPPEARVIQGAVDQSNLGDRIAGIGPWQGESTDEVVEILRRACDDGARKLPDLL